MLVCDICGGPANGFECDWPVDRFIPKKAKALQVGDVVCRMSRKKSAGVATIANATRRTSLSILIELSIKWPWKTRTRLLDVRAEANFLVKTSTVCGNHMCDKCMIERDANRMTVCRNHWMAWESVA